MALVWYYNAVTRYYIAGNLTPPNKEHKKGLTSVKR